MCDGKRHRSLPYIISELASARTICFQEPLLSLLFCKGSSRDTIRKLKSQGPFVLCVKMGGSDSETKTVGPGSDEAVTKDRDIKDGCCGATSDGSRGAGIKMLGTPPSLRLVIVFGITIWYGWRFLLDMRKPAVLLFMAVKEGEQPLQKFFERHFLCRAFMTLFLYRRHRLSFEIREEEQSQTLFSEVSNPKLSMRVSPQFDAIKERSKSSTGSTTDPWLGR